MWPLSRYRLVARQFSCPESKNQLYSDDWPGIEHSPYTIQWLDHPVPAVLASTARLPCRYIRRAPSPRWRLLRPRICSFSGLSSAPG
ncbi:hypothetical protein WR30_26120 [Burkholderia contaminans FFH2055]|nr:hypothetical protein WR30_26120 [Burkholderia contaminans FFH2055]